MAFSNYNPFIVVTSVISCFLFQYFNKGIECNGGGLAIYDGPSNTHNILICGKWSNETLLSSGNTMFMRLSDLSLRNGDIIHLHYETIGNYVQCVSESTLDALPLHKYKI